MNLHRPFFKQAPKKLLNGDSGVAVRAAMVSGCLTRDLTSSATSKIRWMLIAGCLGIGTAFLPADEGSISEIAHSEIPHAYPQNRYQASWKSNPFWRRTTPVSDERLVWANDWALAGMYRNVSGIITVSLRNKRTGEYKHVSSEPSANDKFILVSAGFNRNRDEASVEVAFGHERATLKYEDAPLNPSPRIIRR